MCPLGLLSARDFVHRGFYLVGLISVGAFIRGAFFGGAFVRGDFVRGAFVRAPESVSSQACNYCLAYQKHLKGLLCYLVNKYLDNNLSMSV